ncbi:MAG: hypothetical protein E7434_01510 [Ruminococcaceae bacterium]|nr:hypothetical protein [Oscillospiraceae bacterium]
MKREYVKPYLGLESFQLDAAVATACSTLGFYPIRHREENCTFDDGQFYNFFNCLIDLTDDTKDQNDAICYHGPLASGGIVFTWS